MGSKIVLENYFMCGRNVTMYFSLSHGHSWFVCISLFSVTVLSFILFSPSANANEYICISWHMPYLCMRRQNSMISPRYAKNHKNEVFKSIIHDDDDLTTLLCFFGFSLESGGRWMKNTSTVSLKYCV